MRQNVTTTCQTIAVSDFEETGNRHCQQIPFCHEMCEGDWLALLMLCTSCALQSGRRQSWRLSDLTNHDVAGHVQTWHPPRYQAHATSQASQTNPAPQQSRLLTHHHSTTAMYSIRDATFKTTLYGHTTCTVRTDCMSMGRWVAVIDASALLERAHCIMYMTFVIVLSNKSWEQRIGYF